MAKQNISPEERALHECEVLVNYALSQGRKIPQPLLERLDRLRKEATKTRSLTGESSIAGDELGDIYADLAKQIHPARPSAVLTLEKSKTSWLRFLGPVPLVRKMMLMTLFFVGAFLSLFLSPDVNSVTINGDILSYPAEPFLFNQLFIISIAALGASFYALFEAYKYVANASFDDNYESMYWIRFVLGIVSGVILAQFILPGISPEELGTSIAANDLNNRLLELGLRWEDLSAEDKFRYFKQYGSAGGNLMTYKPLLAFLGGFSARVVHKILNSLVDSVETFISGSARDAIRAREEVAQVQLQDRLKAVQRDNEARDQANRLQAALHLMKLQEKMSKGELNDAEMQTQLQAMMDSLVKPVEGGSMFGDLPKVDAGVKPQPNEGTTTNQDSGKTSETSKLPPPPADNPFEGLDELSGNTGSNDEGSSNENPEGGKEDNEDFK